MSNCTNKVLHSLCQLYTSLFASVLIAAVFQLAGDRDSVEPVTGSVMLLPFFGLEGAV